MVVAAQDVLAVVRDGKLEQLNLFCKEDPGCLNAVDENCSGALHVAARAGHTHVVDYLLKQASEPSKTNCRGQSPLHYACQKGCSEVAELLIKAGADIDAKTKMGCTPLYFAAAKGHLEVARMLISAGANVNSLTEVWSTPLMAAAYGNHLGMVGLLLDSEADPNIQNTAGMTALHIAADKAQTAVFNLLKSYKQTNVSLLDKRGRTADDILAAAVDSCTATVYNVRGAIDDHEPFDLRRKAESRRCEGPFVVKSGACAEGMYNRVNPRGGEQESSSTSGSMSLGLGSGRLGDAAASREDTTTTTATDAQSGPVSDSNHAAPLKPTVQDMNDSGETDTPLYSRRSPGSHDTPGVDGTTTINVGYPVALSTF